MDQVTETQQETTPARAGRARVGRGRRAGRRLFDVWSRVYDAPAAQRLVYRPVQDAVVAHLDTADGIVDLGCGTGLLTRRLAEQHPTTTVVGCDLSWGMLQQASGTPSGARWVQGDAQALPLTTGSTDVVVCTESFHWYPDQGAALAEIRRVLRPGGRLLVAFVNPRAAVMARIASAVAAAVGPPAQWWTRHQLAALVDAAGFDVDEQATVRRIGALVLPTVLTIATRR